MRFQKQRGEMAALARQARSEGFHLKKTLVFLFFLVAGTLVGSMIANASVNSDMLGWLSFGTTIGIPFSSPLVLDLAIVRLSFGIEMGINIAQIITITLAILIYRYVAVKL